MAKGWLIPITNPPHGERIVRICRACERIDPFVQGITKADAGIHAAPTPRWQLGEIDACEHPQHDAQG